MRRGMHYMENKESFIYCMPFFFFFESHLLHALHANKKVFHLLHTLHANKKVFHMSSN